MERRSYAIRKKFEGRLTMIDVNKIREDFESIKNNNIIYFDNSSTTQKPKEVIDAVNEYYNQYCANTVRGTYSWANKATKKVEETREKLSKFINSNSVDEVFFTSGATYSSNLIAYSWGLSNLEDNDEIILCYEDHKSATLPFINIKEILKKFNKNINIVESIIDVHGDYNEIDLFSKITTKTKLVVLTHIHNIYGIENDIELIANEIKKRNCNCKIVLDASQSVGHIKVDVQKLNVDFLYFSGHKMFALNGIGVIWIKKEIQNDMTPFIVGGGFKAKTSSKEALQNTPKDTYYYECGTLNISSIISLGVAIDYINKLGLENISNYISELTRYLEFKLRENKMVELEKGISKCSCHLGFGIIVFKVNGIKSYEIGEVLRR